VALLPAPAIPDLAGKEKREYLIALVVNSVPSETSRSVYRMGVEGRI
jgi:hypothetical protein